MSKEAKKKSDDDELDLGALSALVRPSMAPPSADDGDDAKVDLRALVASVPPPAPAELDSTREESGVQAKSEKKADEPKAKDDKPAKKGSADKGDAKDKKPAAKSEPKAVVPVVAPAPAPASNNGMWVGLGIAVAAIVGGYVYVSSQNSGASATSERPPTHTSSGASSAGSHASTGSSPAEIEAAPTVAAPTVAEAEAEGTTAAPTTAEPSEATTAEPTPAEPTAAGAIAAVQPTAEAEDGHDDGHDDEHGREDDERRRGPSSRGTERSRGAAGGAAAPEAASAPHAGEAEHHEERASAGSRRGGHEAEAEPAHTAPPEQHASIDDAVGRALGGGGSRAATPAPSRPSTAELPDTPSRQEIAQVLGRLMPRIRQCAGEQVGMAVGTIMLRNDGTVASAAVGGSPFGGTPQGACMEGVLREAHFSPFRQTTFRVQYPMRVAAQ